LASPQDDVGGITYNSGTGELTVPTDGTYFMACNFSFSGNTTNGRRAAIVKVNGSTVAQVDFHSSVNQQVAPTAVTTKRLVAGDKVSFALFQNTGAALSMGSSQVNNWGSVTKVDGVKGDPGPPGPSTMSGLDTCRINQTTAQSFADGVAARMQFQAVEAGSTAGMADVANNQIVIVTAGLYAIDASMFMAGSTANIKAIWLLLNGVRFREARMAGSGVTAGHFASAHRWLAAGDTLQVNVVQNQGSAMSTSINSGDNCLSAYQLR
jgi:hypothetical protein